MHIDVSSHSDKMAMMRKHKSGHGDCIRCDDPAFRRQHRDYGMV